MWTRTSSLTGMDLANPLRYGPNALEA